jgi:hypothetical protein
MKALLFLLLALMTGIVSAMSVHRPYRKPLKPAHVETTHHPVSWKTVAAGGAAAGTVVAAYKIGSGVEEGMATAAKEAPVAFLSSITLSSLFIPLIAVVGIPVVGFFIWQKLSS